MNLQLRALRRIRNQLVSPDIVDSLPRMMGHRMGLAALVVAVASMNAAAAKDTGLCPASMVCASYPEGVLRAVNGAGIAARLEQDAQGDPVVRGEAAGYKFDLFFYGCEGGKACDSLQFQVGFRKDAGVTGDLANRWNASKRFLQAGVRPNGDLVFSYDLTTVGGVSAANFGDILTWWEVMLGELPGFFDTNLPKTDLVSPPDSDDAARPAAG